MRIRNWLTLMALITLAYFLGFTLSYIFDKDNPNRFNVKKVLEYKNEKPNR